jgi:hypothetical protein
MTHNTRKLHKTFFDIKISLSYYISSISRIMLSLQFTYQNFAIFVTGAEMSAIHQQKRKQNWILGQRNSQWQDTTPF